MRGFIHLLLLGLEDSWRLSMTARNLLIKSDRAYAIGWKPTQFEPMSAGMEHWLEPALRQTSWT